MQIMKVNSLTQLVAVLTLIASPTIFFWSLKLFASIGAGLSGAPFNAPGLPEGDLYELANWSVFSLAAVSLMLGLGRLCINNLRNRPDRDKA